MPAVGAPPTRAMLLQTLLPPSQDLQGRTLHPEVFRSLLTQLAGGLLCPHHHGSPSSKARVVACTEAGEVYSVSSGQLGLLYFPQLSGVHLPQSFMPDRVPSHLSSYEGLSGGSIDWDVFLWVRAALRGQPVRLLVTGDTAVSRHPHQSHRPSFLLLFPKCPSLRCHMRLRPRAPQRIHQRSAVRCDHRRAPRRGVLLQHLTASINAVRSAT